MVNDCWCLVALTLLGPHWRYDDNTAVCWSQFTIQSTAGNTFTLPYIYHTTWYIRMMKHVVAPYLMDPLVYIGCPWSRIQTQHDLKSPVYQSLIVPLLLESISSTTWPARHAHESGKYLKSIAFLPNACAGGRHLQQAVWPLLLFSTSTFLPLSLQLLPGVASFVSWPYLSAAMCSVSVVSW